MQLPSHTQFLLDERRNESNGWDSFPNSLVLWRQDPNQADLAVSKLQRIVLVVARYQAICYISLEEKWAIVYLSSIVI